MFPVVQKFCSVEGMNKMLMTAFFEIKKNIGSNETVRGEKGYIKPALLTQWGVCRSYDG